MTTQLSLRIEQLKESRTPFVQATVVRAQKPSSASAGDRAIVLADGSIEGFVGGQCATGSVRTAALGALETGEGVLLRVLPDHRGLVPGGPRRQRGGQPLPVRWRPGDLPGAAAALPGGAPRRAPRPRPRRWPRWRPLLGFVVEPAADGRRAAGRGRGGGLQPRRRRGGRGPGRAGRRRRASSGWSAAAPAARRCWTSSTSPSRGARRVHPHVGHRHRCAHRARDRAVDPGRGGARHPGRGSQAPPGPPVRRSRCARSAAPAARPVQAVDPVCGMTVTVVAGHPAR